MTRILSHIICILIVLVMVMPSMAGAEKPSGADLLAACQGSLEQGFSGIQGMLCSWYVTPCDCDYDKNHDLPRVCLPDTTDIDLLARQVVSGLNESPELHNMEADIAASIILNRIYPCTE